MEVELKVDGEVIDLSSCPPGKDHMACFLTGDQIDIRAACCYCWLHRLLESGHPDAGIGRLQAVNNNY